MASSLESVLGTYCVFRPDRGYIQGMSYLAANLLLYMDSFSAFSAFCNLLNLPFFHCLLTLDDEVMAPRLEVFKALFEHNEPTLFRRFEDECIWPNEYFLDWALSLFTKKLSISVASRLWDMVLLFGEIEIYRAAVAVLAQMAKALLAADSDRIRKVLQTLPLDLKQGPLLHSMKAVAVPKALRIALQNIDRSKPR